MPWFYGSITRDKAEELLTPREDGKIVYMKKWQTDQKSSVIFLGLFLVRESTNFPGDYTLCVCYQNSVEHYRVIYKHRQLTIDEEEYFDTLAQLIEV